MSSKNYIEDRDPSAVSRKKDHIELAFQSQVNRHELDSRFYYEPMLSGHPQSGSLKPFSFLGKELRTPLWVSSMTGGTSMAATINRNLAIACKEFGMGMGLGSCRSLLSGDTYFEDFNVRKYIGPDQPLYANLGIAQMEILLREGKTDLILKMIHKLDADGLIIHVNPLQEWLQPEGDIIDHPPIETISRFLELHQVDVIVKEVGQGFGPQSMKALMQLPIKGIEFAANGGTNFARLELLRASEMDREVYGPVVQLGHSAEEMLEWSNHLADAAAGKEIGIIISGGIKHFLDGYHLITKSKLPAVYGQASAFLKYAREDYNTLQKYVEMQVKGLELATSILKSK
jgi:isopentenyl-diphosphate delta-isomerase